MPGDFFTNADKTVIAGPLSIIADPVGPAASLNVAGNLTVTGSQTVSSNLTVSNLATLAEIGGGVLGAASAVALVAGGTVTIGSGVRIVRVSVAAIAGTLNLPTDSVDGREITVLNVGTAALTLVTGIAISLAVASGVGARLTWDVATTLWFHAA